MRGKGWGDSWGRSDILRNLRDPLHQCTEPQCLTVSPLCNGSGRTSIVCPTRKDSKCCLYVEHTITTV